ncbi:restriction endonuclease subunit S [Acinetobacter ursingii]|uniref:restriction endonuclease subunit S n=5 Tax=Moraxellaceae TaxID=468 RepID=UPI0021CDE4FB|nr:restriction endonuclease subunit S [Acinetobacter ursingii]MCU4495693.1 restriction endonuclease subunit S [Acinetobacter ursingii]
MEKQKCPELRFSQFKNDWNETTLGDVVDIVGGGTPDTNVPEFWNGDIDWYSPTEIGENVYANGSTKKITALGLKNCSAKILPAKKTVLFSSRAGIGDMAILDKPAATNQGFQSFVANNIDVYFLYSMGVKIKKFALSKASGSTFLEISRNQLAQMEFLAPSIDSNEQTQIGNFFQNLDQSIALHEKKLAQTQNLKKAMLEKMFPKAGSTQPEIRLKGFSGDWMNSQLSNFISIKHGFAFDGVYFSEIETNLCLLTPGNFMIGGGFKAEKFIYYNGEVPENYILQENDLLVTMTDLSKESDTLGLPALLPLMRGKTLLHNQRLGLVSFDNDELDKGFLFYLLQTKSYHKYIVLSATGTTVKHTSPNKILAFVCDVPEFEEQKGIGNFFKQLDETLALQQQQLQTLKNLKQAFLEKMFV